MKWFKKIWSIFSLKERLKLLQEKADEAERKGNLVLAVKYYHEIEILETKIEDRRHGL